MKRYDVVIIGGGIAGCGLAYNLRRVCPKKSVLLIERNEIGAGGGKILDHRSVFKETVDEYPLVVWKKFDGLIISTNDTMVTSIDEDIFSVDYQKSCKQLLTESKADYVIEEAKEVRKNRLVTDRFSYLYHYLIDCSGKSFFFRKLWGFREPENYWVGKIEKRNGSHEMNQGYLYTSWHKDGRYREIHPGTEGFLDLEFHFMNRKTKDEYLKNHSCHSVNENEEINWYPVSPTPPIAQENMALLGDSFGSATTGGGFGVSNSLNHSHIVALGIERGDLEYYKKYWLREEGKNSLTNLSSKLSRYNQPAFLKKLFSVPDISSFVKEFKYVPSYWIDFLKGKNPRPPKRILKKFSWRYFLFLLMIHLKVLYNFCTQNIRTHRLLKRILKTLPH